MIETIKNKDGKITAYILYVEDDLKPLQEEEDEGDDIYACMVESLGDNWW